ncbi:DUF6597 domain-containing transcriptional factor [Abyssalbus ytuae]|uniref:AraC family transcriptional regulator n=1 Tax=Abyssalbus ytuae TaxID=2926907 RepID=A0A9E7CZX4_9FLAO|nr:AraC family transcriptional regulator [Abyssalbus ytuae]UOB17950.1 AraC family transcriptional regulator [Abyssalbus ytuae]
MERTGNYRITPPSEYDEVFSHFYFAKNDTEELITKTLLPSYQTILVFVFKAKALLVSKENTLVKIEKSIVLGPIKKVFDYSLPPHCEILVVNFKDDAFYRFFGSPLIAGGAPVNPDKLLPENCFTAIWTELNKIENVQERINYILEFCKPYLGQRNNLVKEIINFNTPNQNPIQAIAEKQNQTVRNIQLKHKQYLGYTAKEINRYQRFIKAVWLIQKLVSENSEINWFEIINDCGYYDQSQLIHDFKYYINLSPAKYLKFQKNICSPLS